MSSPELDEARGLTSLLAGLQEVACEASVRRRELIKQLLAAGWTVRGLAGQLGVSGSEVHRLARGGRREAERDV